VRKAGLEQEHRGARRAYRQILLRSRLDASKSGYRRRWTCSRSPRKKCARYENAELEGEPVAVRGDPRLLRRMPATCWKTSKRHGTAPIEVRVSRTGTARNWPSATTVAAFPRTSANACSTFLPRGERAGLGPGSPLVRQIARRHGGRRAARRRAAGQLFRRGPAASFLAEPYREASVVTRS